MKIRNLGFGIREWLAHLFQRNVIIFVFFRYTCVGRNGFNKEGDREEGHVQVNFVKGKSQYEQKTEILKISGRGIS